MAVHLADIVGTLAGTLTTLSFLPQVLRTWRSRSAHDFSLVMLLAFATGVGLWIVYGFILAEAPIVVFNVITFVLVTFLLGMKLRYDTNPVA